MNDSESESDREGEQFFYDDIDNNVVYPKRIRRRSKTSHHVMTINNAYYKTTQDMSALRIGFDALNKKREETLCDCCFHGIVCSFIIFFIHKTVIENFYHFFR